MKCDIAETKYSPTVHSEDDTAPTLLQCNVESEPHGHDGVIRGPCMFEMALWLI